MEDPIFVLLENKIVDFTYLPGLYANGGYYDNSKIFIFPDMEKVYNFPKEEELLYNKEIKLKYKFEIKKIKIFNLKIDISKETYQNNQKKVIFIKTIEPTISKYENPVFLLMVKNKDQEYALDWPPDNIYYLSNMHFGKWVCVLKINGNEIGRSNEVDISW